MNKPYVHRTITCTFLVIFSCLLMASPLHAFTPGSVRVRVTDLYSQAPLSGAAVLMTPGSYSGTTDDNGTLIFSGITPYRNYAVTATIDGYVEGKYGDGRTGFIWVENTRETTVAIALRHATTISGRVSAETEPVAEAMVVAIEERKDGPATIAAARTADNGTYTLVVPEGNYSLAAVADSYYKTQLDRTVGAGETLEQNFTLKPGSTRMSYTIRPSNAYYGSSVSLKPDN
ncbi:MAG: carboxypeptidase regulatory-like domain-containing protein, partial [Deltaproteobacteria bacterium]|nr:carboxypeptidase regulatory-like domain-containing protein [Deltaproteobacteria bacterium]